MLSQTADQHIPPYVRQHATVQEILQELWFLRQHPNYECFTPGVNLADMNEAGSRYRVRFGQSPHGVERQGKDRTVPVEIIEGGPHAHPDISFFQSNCSGRRVNAYLTDLFTTDGTDTET